MFSPIILLCFLWISAAVHAYIPVTATNDTESAIQGGLNLTDASMLNLLWFENGGSSPYSIVVAYELAGAGSNGISQGAFVHFSERNLTDDTTITPWIALVSCDTNSTDASEIDDIFTLARDRGAVAALVYSLYSSACIINREYADPGNFDQVFDIFSTQSLTTARVVEELFDHIDRNLYGDFNAQRLNESFYSINNTLNDGNSIGPGYMFATLRADNTTEPNMPPATTQAGPEGNGGSRQQGKRTSLTMIILCVINLLIIGPSHRCSSPPSRSGINSVCPRRHPKKRLSRERPISWICSYAQPATDPIPDSIPTPAPNVAPVSSPPPVSSSVPEVNRSTGFSPFQLGMGWSPRIIPPIVIAEERLGDLDALRLIGHIEADVAEAKDNILLAKVFQVDQDNKQRGQKDAYNLDDPVIYNTRDQPLPLIG